MTFNEYQDLAETTAVYSTNYTLIYPALGLAGETGEVVEKVKKLVRDNNAVADEKFIEGIKKELGDVLWYVAILARDCGLKLDDIAQGNYEKLKDRKERNMIHGSGDNR